MLEVKNLHQSYRVGNRDYPVLKGIDFTVEDGEFVAVMGSSGAGKTTLLNSISCYIPVKKGDILLSGNSIANLNEEALARVRNEKLGFVFQDFMLLDGLCAKENIMLPRIIAGKVGKEMENSADRLCEIFGIGHIKDKFPAELSGGEKQRTAVARSLINNPLLLLADEPTGALDSKSALSVIGAFEQAKKELGATVLMVTHDSFSASFCDRVILLKDGLVYKIVTRETQRSDFQDLLLAEIKEMSNE